jgi:hypothetical protein
MRTPAQVRPRFVATENISQKIAVMGATGRVGSHLVEIFGKPCMSSRGRSASAWETTSSSPVPAPGSGRREALERMFEEGGVQAGESAEPPQQEYDLEAAAALAKRCGFEVVGPQLA